VFQGEPWAGAAILEWGGTREGTRLAAQELFPEDQSRLCDSSPPTL
jgi:hypothetical protein